jgi:hypothetical protein
MHADPEARCFSKEKKLPTGTDNEVSEWNQYRYGTGITIHNLTSVPMRADPEARCISKKTLPTGTVSKISEWNQ